MYSKSKSNVAEDNPIRNRSTANGLTWGWVRPGTAEWLVYLPGLALVVLYTWCLDDAFIYFRYVDNFIAGNGLVYNRGEFVEGFTSPLWCLLLILLRALGLDYAVIILLSGVVAYTCFWYILIVVNRTLSPPDSQGLNLPLAMLAPNFAVATWFTSGMETPLVLVVAALVAVYVMARENRGIGILLGLAPLVRPELALTLVILFLWKVLQDRRIPWGLAAWWLLFNGSWLAFRIYYYADLFPNTYYLKAAFAPWQGLLYLHDALQPYHFLLLVAAMGVFLHTAGRPISRRATRPCPRAVLLFIAVLQTAYVVKMGGDTWHFRLLLFPYVLVVVAATAGLADQVAAGCAARGQQFLVPAGLLFVFLLTLGSYPRQLAQHPVRVQLTQLLTPEGDEKSSIFDLYPHVYSDGIECPSLYSCKSFITRAHIGAGQRDPREDAGGLANRPYAEVLTSWWCVTNWENIRSYAVHPLGLTQPVLARFPAPSVLPGHKFGLVPLGEDIAAISRAHGNAWVPGMFRQAVEEGNAPAWIAQNLDAIEMLEQKALNTHGWRKNLSLAFTRVPPLVSPTL